jgi:molybdenum cofactor cytidylyltransferase
MFDRFKAWFQAKPPLTQDYDATISVAGLLLAAGRGSRFDNSGKANKLLARFDERPIISHSADALASAVDKRIAVIRPDASDLSARQSNPNNSNNANLRKLLENAGYIVVECPDAASGMGHSIAWGVAEAMKVFDMERLVIALGDMPSVKPSTIQALIIASKKSNCIIAPSYLGKRGNPVVFQTQHFEALSRLSGDRGASQFMKTAAVELIEVDDPGILKDIDSHDDLA